MKPMRHSVIALMAILSQVLATAADGPVAEESALTPDGQTPTILENFEVYGRVLAFASHGGRAAAIATPRPGNERDTLVRFQTFDRTEPRETIVQATVRALVFSPDGATIFGISHRGKKKRVGDTYLFAIDTATMKLSQHNRLPRTARNLDIWPERNAVLIASVDEVRTILLDGLRSGPLFRIAGSTRSIASVGGSLILLGQDDGLVLVDLDDPPGPDVMPIRGRLEMPAPVLMLADASAEGKVLARDTANRLYEVTLAPLEAVPFAGQTSPAIATVAPPPRQPPAPPAPDPDRPSDPAPQTAEPETDPAETTAVTASPPVPPETPPSTQRPTPPATPPTPSGDLAATTATATAIAGSAGPAPTESPATATASPPEPTTEADAPPTARVEPPVPVPSATAPPPEPAAEPDAPRAPAPPATVPTTASPPVPPAEPDAPPPARIEPPEPALTATATAATATATAPPPEPAEEPDLTPAPMTPVAPTTTPQPERAAQADAPPPSSASEPPAFGEPSPNARLWGRLLGPEADAVGSVVLLGPNNMLTEALRVTPRDRIWEVAELAPGRYRVQLDGGGDRVIVARPGFLLVEVEPSGVQQAPDCEIVRVVEPEALN